MVKNRTSGMTKEQYLDMMYQMGSTPKEEEIPWEEEDFPYEVQQAFRIYKVLPDNWDTFGGSYLGKNYSSVVQMFDLLQITEDREDILYFIKHIDAYETESINNSLEAKKKSKAKN